MITYTASACRCALFSAAAALFIPSIRSQDPPEAPPASGAYSEKLEMVTDASVADALQRQNNLNFSSVRIDGETPDIPLSALTADQILNAVATKVATPDLDADAVGGLLQLTSRRAFDQAERTLRGSSGVAWDPLVGRPSGEASITYGRSLGAKKRFGFLATLEHQRGHDRDEEIDVDWDAGTARVDKFQVGAKEDFSAGRYAHDGFPDFDALRRLFETRPDRFALNVDKTRSDTDPRNYDVRQDILAAYVMGSAAAGTNRIVAGVRAEQTASRFLGYEVAFDELGRYESTRPISARTTTTDLFPGVHFSRPLSDRVTIFASWTRSIRRPDYTDLVPARRISRADREIDEGNTDLRSALYTNYDAAVDWSYRDDGRLSFDRGPYYVSVEYEHTSRTLDSIGRARSEDRLVLAWNMWNISISREFRRGIRVILDTENLTGTSERRYAGDPSRPDRYSLDLREYKLGMKWER